MLHSEGQQKNAHVHRGTEVEKETNNGTDLPQQQLGKKIPAPVEEKKPNEARKKSSVIGRVIRPFVIDFIVCRTSRPRLAVVRSHQSTRASAWNHSVIQTRRIRSG